MIVMMKKLKNNIGMSLTETLFSVLLISIIFTAVTSGISVVRMIYSKVILRADALSVMATANAAIDADLLKATDIKTDDDTADYEMGISFISGKRRIRMGFLNTDKDGNTGMIWAHSKNAKNVDTGERDVYIPVVTDAAKTDKLSLEMNGFSYNQTGKYFEYTLTVTDVDGNEISKKFAVATITN